jgi:hypothetical protein
VIGQYSYHFKMLRRLDWVQLNRDDIEQNDLWSMYLPPRVCSMNSISLRHTNRLVWSLSVTRSQHTSPSPQRLLHRSCTSDGSFS